MASVDILRAAHSPLPWSVMPNNPRMVRGSKPVLVADTASFVLTGTEECAANAAFIVRACNAHYQMLEAPKAIDGALSQACGDVTERAVQERIGELAAEPWLTVRAAINQAEGR